MSRKTIDFLRKIFGKSRRTDFLGDLRDIAFAEDRFRRAVSCALCIVVLGLLFCALCLNWYEQNLDMMLVLGGVLLGVICSLVWLWLSEDAVYGPPYLLLGILALLGGYLLLDGKETPTGSLFWFLIFPPMVMLCLGLRRGILAFSVFFIFLVLLMATPLHSHLAVSIEASDRFRFLAAMLGAFTFSLCMEFLRFQTQFALGRTMARLEQDSLTDPLTGLGNRRDFYNHCQWMLDSSPGRLPAYSLAIVDIDHFKKVNDTHGHDVGDRVLRHVANVLSSHIRSSDRLYRWGGEEFLILMPRTVARDARFALERMRRTVEKTPYTEAGLSVFFTISIGLYSGIMNQDQTSQIAKADQNLYVAKETGRNKIVG